MIRKSQHSISNAEINKTIIKFSFIAAIVYMVFFGLMKMSGYAEVTELRFFNYFLYAIVGAAALQELRKKGEGKIYYLNGFAVALLTGIVSFVIFGGFIYVYSLFNNFFTSTLQTIYPGAMTLGYFAAPVIIAAEGIAISSIVALCLMQYFKRYAYGKTRRDFDFLDTSVKGEVHTYKS